MQSGRQTARRIIIFRRTGTPAILFWAYSYAGLSNFGRFGQIFWRIIRSLTEALIAGEIVMSLSNYRCLLTLFVCGASVVFTIVDGQATSDDDIDRDMINTLSNTVDELKVELRVEQAKSARSAEAIAQLKSQLSAKGNGRISVML